MDKLKRMNKLLELLEKSGGIIKTRKRFHKLVYLLQEAGEDFDQDFYYHYFGVYSSTLANDLEFAVSLKLISESPDESNLIKYELNPEKEKLPFEYDHIGNKGMLLIKKLVNKEPRLLEVLSTIVYLSQNKYLGEDLVTKLNDLKGQHEAFFNDAFQLADELFHIKADYKSLISA